MIRLLERHLLVSVLLLAGLVALCLAAWFDLGNDFSELRTLPASRPAAYEALFRGEVRPWFDVESAARRDPPTDSINPFFTLYFQPPPPPPTKKVELLYQGSFTSSKGVPYAYVLLGDKQLVLTNGARVIADHGIRDIKVPTLTLTNTAVQTNVLQFNVKAVLEIPAS